VPTPKARECADSIGQSLASLEKLVTRTMRFVPAECRRSFTIAMRDSHEATFLPSILSALQDVAPEVGVATVRIDRRDVEEDLQTGELDLAVDMALPVSADVHRERVLAEPLVVLVRKDHPKIRSTLDLDTYLAMEHVLVTGRRRGLGYEDAALQRLNLTRRVRIRCQHHAAASEVVAKTNFLATMPRSYAVQFNRSTDNQTFDFPIDNPLLELFLYWHANVQDDPAHRWFRELASRCI